MGMAEYTFNAPCHRRGTTYAGKDEVKYSLVTKVGTREEATSQTSHGSYGTVRKSTPSLAIK